MFDCMVCLQSGLYSKYLDMASHMCHKSTIYIMIVSISIHITIVCECKASVDTYVQNQNQNQNNFISETYNVSNIKINLLLMGANSWKPI